MAAVVPGYKGTARNVCFTHFDPAWDPATESKMDKIKYMVINHEICPKTNKLHWQGYAELKSADRVTGVQKTLGGKISIGAIFRRMHSAEAAIHYCKKPVLDCKCPECGDAPLAVCKCKHCTDCALVNAEHKHTARFIEFGERGAGQGKRVDLDEAVATIKANPGDLKKVVTDHTSTFIRYHAGIERAIAVLDEIKLPDPGLVLRPWQHVFLQSVTKGFVGRQILWLWSQASGTGKTETMKHVAFTLGVDFYLPGSWKKDDMLYAYNKHKVIHFNIPRDQELHDTHLSVLEALSDGGLQLSTKYFSKAKILSAVIVVTANIPPPRHRLPKRFVEWCLDEPEPTAKTDAAVADLPLRYGLTTFGAVRQNT